MLLPADVQGRTNAGKDMSDHVLWLYRLRDGKIVGAELVDSPTPRARSKLSVDELGGPLRPC
jgi:hypothetical protein